MTHTVAPVANPLNAAATVCSICGAPVSKVNASAAKVGWKHYTSTKAYKAKMLAALNA